MVLSWRRTFAYAAELLLIRARQVARQKIDERFEIPLVCFPREFGDLKRCQNGHGRCCFHTYPCMRLFHFISSV